MNLEFIITEDGSHTLLLPELKEHYHSVHGAIAESQHIFINAGIHFALQKNTSLNILEIGFGTGLNALLAYVDSVKNNFRCNYTSVEAHPLPENIFSRLNYAELLGVPDEKFLSLHQCKWNEVLRISDHFNFLKMLISALEMILPQDYYDLVFFDAFAPDIQPELWSSQVFSNINASMKKNAILTTYSTKGDVKRTLKSTGFTIEKLPGPKGKREILRACKI
jgi:tRNA U34 5-methylaminomethyl-2-thiouridine-forming methyltransferase MnmC